MDDRDLRIEVGKRLQEIRGARDQRTFAEAVESVQQTISKYERGEIPRSWMFLARLREEEGVDLNRLLTGQPVREEQERTNGASAPSGTSDRRQDESAEDRRPEWAEV